MEALAEDVIALVEEIEAVMLMQMWAAMQSYEQVLDSKLA